MLIERFFPQEQLDRMVFWKTDASGRPLYFPNGRLGPGFIIANDDQKRNILRHHLRAADILMIGFVAAGVLPMILDLAPMSGLLFMPVLVIANWIWTRRLARGLERSDEKFATREAMAIINGQLSWPVLIFAELFLGFFWIKHVFGFAEAPSWIDAAVTAILTFAMARLAHAMYKKWRYAREAP